MKKLLTMLCAMLLTLSVQAKDKVIDRPAFSGTASDLCPIKVVLTKKSTIVHFRMDCAHRRAWSMTGARLECNGQTYAYQRGRILTHEGIDVLTDEAFELGKEYAQNARQDLLVLYFDPLPKGAKTFDYAEGDKDLSWKVRGVRLDNQLYPSLIPPYKPRVDDGRPLEPIALKHGEATATITVHGGGNIYYVGDFSRDIITGNYDSQSQYLDSTLIYCHPAYTATKPLFTGWNGLGQIDPSGLSIQFPMILIPGETLTLEVDANACVAREQNFAAGKPSAHDYYRLGGTLGDLNQALLENQGFYNYAYMPEVPTYTEGQTFAEWSEQWWQNLDKLRQNLMHRSDYTRRQKEFLSLWVDYAYVNGRHDYERVIRKKMGGGNPEDAIAKLKATYTLEDPHARDLQLFRDGRSFYLPLMPPLLEYLEANGLNHGEVYEMTKALAYAQEIGERMKQGKVQTDSVLQTVHPYFQPVLRAFNDSTRILVERLQREAKDRIMETPDVPGSELLDYIVRQHPGKAVFIDLWATWCGPCLNGIQAMEPLKKELEGRDIVFVYLTDESSPLNQWNEHVLKIPGQHYRIPSSMYRQLPWPPGGGGIPQYYLYDRQGRRVWEQTGFSDDVKKEIESEIKKILQ